MLKDHLQIRTLILVGIGNFNPSIIQPFWLASKGLIGEQEAKTAKVEIIHPQLSRFELEWVFIEVSEERFMLKTSKAPYFNATKDLLEGIFNFLPETPIKAIGLNHLLHFNIPTQEEYYEIGNKLAPLRLWDKSLDDPRLLELGIIEHKRRDGLKGHYEIRIQPSDQLAIRTGLLISINDHLALDEKESDKSGILIEHVKQIWNDSFKRADATVEELDNSLRN